MATRLNICWLRSLVGLVLGVTSILTFAQGAMGQVAFELIHAFGSGYPPKGSLVRASDGDFYGTTEAGGTFGGGTVFKLTAAGTLTTLHAFDCSTEGCAPAAGLVQAADGNFYGTTAFGGADRAGTVFKMDSDGTVTTLHSFDCRTGGCFPRASLIETSAGTFYGTTESGGAFGGGTVFTLTTAGTFTTVTTLHAFDCDTNGCEPHAGLIRASDGKFYGTTGRGGGAGGGTVFQITAGSLTTQHSFDCSTGCGPRAGLIQASDGNFYGTTEGGGAFGAGTVFKLTSAGTFTLLHSLLHSFDCRTEGCVPFGGLIQASDSHFYGTTAFGGTAGGGDIFMGGTVFKMDRAGTVTTLHSFDCITEGSTEGCLPAAGLIQASDGTFYGTTVLGGVGFGTVFKITDAGLITTLHMFFCGTEGCSPPAGVTQARDGNFYGTTSAGGTAQGGTVFKLTADGSLTTLHSFDCSTEGCGPTTGLIQASDGNFYGTTSAGGTAQNGTVFKLPAAGSLTTLHSFDCSTEGCGPTTGLIQASDGNFYGTTAGGGIAGGGTVFKMDGAGTVTTLHSFDCSTEACSPGAGLIQGSDGHFYGTTGGSIFKITAAGSVTTLHTFDDCSSGCAPVGGLIQTSDGTFYGMAQHGGAADVGTVFKLTAAGSLTTLHSFDCSTEGCIPYAGLIQASDGNFYGTTNAGGTAGGGTIFKLTPAGTFTTLHDFDCSTGCSPIAGLIQASDGTFYGTTQSGGPGGLGVVFRLVGRLSPLSPAKVWIGLKNSDDVGLRLDLLAETFVDGTKVGEGRLNNVSAGSSGFNNAALNTIFLDRIGEPMSLPVGSALEVKVSVRRTCAGGGHASGTARLWYNGQPNDRGSKRDAGSRLDVISGGATTSNLLRSGFALSTAPGTSRQSIDVSVDSKQSCPNRTFKVFGIWSNNR